MRYARLFIQWVGCAALAGIWELLRCVLRGIALLRVPVLVAGLCALLSAGQFFSSGHYHLAAQSLFDAWVCGLAAAALLWLRRQTLRHH